MALQKLIKKKKKKRGTKQQQQNKQTNKQTKTKKKKKKKKKKKREREKKKTKNPRKNKQKATKNLMAVQKLAKIPQKRQEPVFIGLRGGIAGNTHSSVSSVGCFALFGSGFD